MQENYRLRSELLKRTQELEKYVSLFSEVSELDILFLKLLFKIFHNRLYALQYSHLLRDFSICFPVFFDCAVLEKGLKI